MAGKERRLQKELRALLKDPPAGIHVDADQISQNMSEWVVDVTGVPGTLYDGEQFKLQFKFGTRYPFDSPTVQFVGPNIPLHPHIYSNGFICLSILGDAWSPAFSVQSVCLSIISMLSSAKAKKRPPDNWFATLFMGSNPKRVNYYYHNDSV